MGIKSVAPDLGVDYSYLSKIENDVVSPSAELLTRFAQYYGAESDELYRVAGRLPPDVREILQQHFNDAVTLLRSRFRLEQRQPRG